MEETELGPKLLRTYGFVAMAGPVSCMLEGYLQFRNGRFTSSLQASDGCALQACAKKLYFASAVVDQMCGASVVGLQYSALSLNEVCLLGMNCDIRGRQPSW